MRTDLLKKNGRFYFGMMMNVIEGLLAGAPFFVLYEAMEMLFYGNMKGAELLRLSLFLGGIFLVRILLFSVGYTESQIGGAAVSYGVRLFLGDKLKKSPPPSFL